MTRTHAHRAASWPLGHLLTWQRWSQREVLPHSKVSYTVWEAWQMYVFQPLSYLCPVNLLSQAVHTSSYSHGLIKSMESFCSLQRELHNRVKAAALRTEVLVSIMHIVIYSVFIFLLYSLQLLSALKGRSTLTWLKWFNTEDPIHFFE